MSVAILLGTTIPGVAQVRVPAPAGVLTGMVRDSVTGEPVGYALVALLERGERTFASESGRFSLPGIPAGRATLRVTQIGYRATTMALDIEAETGTAGAGITVWLTRQPVILPEVLARSEACPPGIQGSSGEESGTVIDEAFRNAERMLALQTDYPYQSSFQHVTTILNGRREAEGRTVDTVELRSRDVAGYEAGKVLVVRRSSDWGRAGLREYANYFQASDLARPEFRRTHCFWMAGRDSVRGFPVYRVEFAPLPHIRTPDWAGILQIDSASMHLLRSEAWLVNLPPASVFTAARCSALYTQLIPTLVLEFQVHCVAAQNVRPAAFTDDRWTLIKRAFLGRRPEAGARSPEAGARSPEPGEGMPLHPESGASNLRTPDSGL